MKVKIVTSKRGSYLQPIGESPSPAAALVRSTKERQTIVGFGGAFTDAAAHVYATMDKEIKEKAIRRLRNCTKNKTLKAYLGQ